MVMNLNIQQLATLAQLGGQLQIHLGWGQISARVVMLQYQSASASL